MAFTSQTTLQRMILFALQINRIDFSSSFSAIFFANNNAANNQGTDAMVCAIFAASQDDWRGTAHKVI
jgi:hypothetical protein